jgi:hypothetical protein
MSGDHFGAYGDPPSSSELAHKRAVRQAESEKATADKLVSLLRRALQILSTKEGIALRGIAGDGLVYEIEQELDKEQKP